MGDDMAMDLGEVTYDTDFTISYQVDGLTKSTMYDVVASCTPSVGGGDAMMSKTASFTTLQGPEDEQPIRFVWAADLAGQGWGRNPEFEITNADGRIVKGGYVVFDTMEKLEPHFALFQGDMIYADNSIPPTKEIPEEVGGGTWINNPSKDFVAVSLDEFRANWKYNFGDEKMESFLLKTPVYVSWVRLIAYSFLDALLTLYTLDEFLAGWPRSHGMLAHGSLNQIRTNTCGVHCTTEQLVSKWDSGRYERPIPA